MGGMPGSPNTGWLCSSAALLPFRIVVSGARFALVTLVRILEPVVRFALGALALLLVLTGLFLKEVSSRPIPLTAMLAGAVGCMGVLALYQAIIRLLS